MISVFWQIVLAIIGGGFISGIFNIITWKLNRNACLEDAEAKGDSDTTAGLRILLYDRIKHLGKRYILDGEISAEDLEDLIAMHKVYHDNLSGNGFLDSVMAQVKRLKIKA